MNTQPTNQPVERSMNWHLSYLREHIYGADDMTKAACVVAMHFAQYPHLYTTSDKLCREYVEGAMRGLWIGDILRRALLSSMEATAWFVAAMTPTAFACADLLVALCMNDDFESRCYEAALMYAWVPESHPWRYPFARRLVRLEHGRVEIWSAIGTVDHGVVSYFPHKEPTDLKVLMLTDANPGWEWDSAYKCISTHSGYGDNQTPLDTSGDDFPAFVTRVVRDPRILGIVEVSP
jgi:hypothetical protein